MKQARLTVSSLPSRPRKEQSSELPALAHQSSMRFAHVHADAALATDPTGAAASGNEPLLFDVPWHGSRDRARSSGVEAIFPASGDER